MSLKVIKTGVLDTVQDNGRWGYQHLGINVGGAIDRFSAQLANALLGKPLNDPVIEMHFPVGTYQIEQASVICLTGGDFSPSINGEAIPMHQPVAINKGAVLKCVTLKNGARCYLSILHTLELESWLGSYSTALKIAAGGYKGRALQKEDTINFRNALRIDQLLKGKTWMPLSWRVEGLHTGIKEVQFIVGNEWNTLSTAMQTLFLNHAFVISPASDRMGYRLSGPPLETTPLSLVSSAVSFGTIQLLPNGQLIVLMADHQTTGGYPRIGHVIGAHLPYLAQAKANDRIRFTMTNHKIAEEKLVMQHQYLIQLQNACKFKMENILNAVR